MSDDMTGYTDIMRGVPTEAETASERDARLVQLVARADAAYDAMTPEQKAAHDKAQRESWVRGMMSTGDPRFD